VWWDSRWELWVWGCEGHELLIYPIRSLAALRLARRGDHAFEDARRVAQAGPDDRRLAYVHSLIITALSSPQIRRAPPPCAPLPTDSTRRSVALGRLRMPRARQASRRPRHRPPFAAQGAGAATRAAAMLKAAARPVAALLEPFLPPRRVPEVELVLKMILVMRARRHPATPQGVSRACAPPNSRREW